MERLNRTAWDNIFKEKGKVFSSTQEGFPRIVKFFKKNNVKRVLDLGCGSGRHLIYLNGHGFDVFGIDISKQGLKIAREWLNKEGLKANLRIGDIYKKLPYEDDFFDAIISTRTLHHARVKEIRRLIKEMERILRPSGLIFITVWKRVPKKDIPKDLVYGIEYIEPRTYMTVDGPEKGLPHYIFNRKILRKEFKNFKIIDLWVESANTHYCLLGQLKNKKI